MQICRIPDVISLADGLRHVPRNLHYDESLSNPAMCVLDGCPYQKLSLAVKQALRANISETSLVPLINEQ